MTFRRSLAVTSLVALILSLPVVVAAQDQPSPGLPSTSPALVRPTISIVAFETDRTGWMPPPHFGETVADLLSNRLVDLGAFRVFDRGLLPGSDRPGARLSLAAIRELAQQSGVDFVVIGAVTRFTNERTKRRGGLLGVPFLGGLGKNTQESSLGLTLRVVDVRTGEVVTAMVAEGAASKSHRTLGGGALVGGLPIGAGFSSSGTGALDRLLAEALAEAIEGAATSLTKAAAKMGGAS